MAQQAKNPTSIHEDVSLIPGPAHRLRVQRGHKPQWSSRMWLRSDVTTAVPSKDKETNIKPKHFPYNSTKKSPALHTEICCKLLRNNKAHLSNWIDTLTVSLNTGHRSLSQADLWLQHSSTKSELGETIFSTQLQKICYNW